MGSSFGDDALAYFTERLDPAPLRSAIARVLQRAKRNKAFDESHLIGFAIDGTGSARCSREKCPLCHPIHDKEHNVTGYNHHFSLISVVGVGLSLPFDVEPYGPGDSEYAARQRLLQRAVENLGPRFADYIVVEGEYAHNSALSRVRLQIPATHNRFRQFADRPMGERLRSNRSGQQKRSGRAGIVCATARPPKSGFLERSYGLPRP